MPRRSRIRLRLCSSTRGQATARFSAVLDRLVVALLGEAGRGLQPAPAQRVAQAGLRRPGGGRRPRSSAGCGVRSDHQRVLLVAQVLRRAAGAGGHHRRPDRHRLQRDQPPRLLPADREQQGVGVGVGGRELARAAGAEGDPPVQARARAQGAQLGQVAPRPRSRGRSAAASGGSCAQRLDGGVDALALVEPPDVEQLPAPSRGPGAARTGSCRRPGGRPRRADRERRPVHGLPSRVASLLNSHGTSRQVERRRGTPASRVDQRSEAAGAQRSAGPGVDLGPVDHPVVADHADRRAAARAPARSATATCRPSPTSTRRRAGARRCWRASTALVVALEREPLAQRDRRELVVVPVPAQLAAHLRVLRNGRVRRRHGGSPWSAPRPRGRRRRRCSTDDRHVSS